VLGLLVVGAVYARSKFAAEKIRSCGVRVCVGEPGAARSTQRLSSVRALLQNAPLAVIVEARNAAQCRSATLEQTVAVKFALLSLRESSLAMSV
jgi:hypothetical protein